MNVRIHQSWKSALRSEFQKDYFLTLADFVKQEYQEHNVYPPPPKIFHAFDQCHLDQVKVVILGQDPYHGPGQANGLCFSVNDGIPMPPSLQNIFQEVANDLGVAPPQHGNLDHWAQQGVLLLNATLTVRAHQPASHQGKGWERFTDGVITYLAQEKERLVFLLWGKYAQDKAHMIDEKKHLILAAPHPSPLSAHRGFFGCKHFSQTNEYLQFFGKEPIRWVENSS